MADGAQYPYVKDLEGVKHWHRRSPMDETVDTPDGCTYGTFCGLEIYSAHVSAFHPDEFEGTGSSREFMCRMCRRLERHDHLVEAMAEHAHNAWLFAYKRMGIKSRKSEWGEEFMVPFDKLSEAGQELDRVIMRAILVAMWRSGYSIFKRWMR